jgi:uncharacterized protein
MTPFIGRKAELKILEGIGKKNSASLIVLKGRRRIGKSRLIDEFAKDQKFYSFTGLPPTSETTEQSQRDAFAKQVKREFKISLENTSDWWDLLWSVAEHTKNDKVIILFDEISWMGSKDPDFLGKLKTVWDSYFKKNQKLILILCGSISSWIEKNILSSTGFMGRLSLTLTLEELPLYDCNKFWIKCTSLSAYEKFKILSVTGGIPRYLEEVHSHLSAEENIRKLGFDKSGILFNEFEQIFSDLFSSRSSIYKQIVTCLGDAKADRNYIAQWLDIEVGGVISNYLDDLVKAGFISRDFSWQFNDGKTSKLSHYRLSDNYLRFYLKLIEPNKRKIESGIFQERTLTSLPGLNTIMGLQFENLVLNNRKLIHKLLDIRPEDIISEGPYFQRTTIRQPGCQIDYLIQTKFDCLYVCEIKFSRYPIHKELINEINEKILRLKRPRYFSCRPVLIHVNGIHEEVEDSEYFVKIISFEHLLEQKN